MALKLSCVALSTIIAIAVAGVLYSFKIGPFRPLLSRERYFAVREAISATPTSIIVLGDSIVESAPLPTSICNIPIVNAGVSGADSRYFLGYLDELLGASSPKLIVLAIGVNDAFEDALPSFHSRYRAILATLSRRAPVLLTTIAPTQPGTFTQLLVPGVVPRLNQAIKELAGQNPVIELGEQMTERNLTTDGVHLNSRGYELWTEAMKNGITKAIGCNPEN